MMKELLLRDLGKILRGYDYGFADISALGLDFTKALVLAVPYKRRLAPSAYAEALFHADCEDSRAEAGELVKALGGVLEQHGVSYRIPETGQRDEKRLEAEVSFKYAAVQAGLGWIGKNDTLVTEKYGPRLRLAILLLDAPVPCGTPATESKCPPGCMLCTKACPCGAVQGKLWVLGEERRERIDYHRCNSFRSADIPVLGRKNACGLCMTACPWGKKK